MDVRRRRRSEVDVRVAVGHAVVGVIVRVDEETPEGAEEYVTAEHDEDETDGPLQHLLELRSDRELECDDGDASTQERERVAGAPERPEEARPDEPALPRDQRRDR